MDLPEDIILNILLRLPVLYLLRFKCVCKHWCVLIESPLFKDRYLALRRAKPVDDQVVGLKLKRYGNCIYRSFVTSWYEDYEPLIARCTAASAPSSSHDDVEILSIRGPTLITGHFNGIVCVIQGGLHQGDDLEPNWFDVTLVNPGLREFRKLPVPDLSEEHYRCFVSISNIGFGYDDATNDYKVFAIVDLVELGDEQIGLVYRLSTDSWRILGNMSAFVMSMSGEALFAHGSFHCIMVSDLNYRILAFNLTTELFQEMLYPRGWRYDKTPIGSCLLTIDKSTIALAAFTRGREQVLDIWVMKEYGDTESWTKLYSITSLPRFDTPLSFWRNDKILLKKFDDRLICYDIITGQVYQYELGGSYDLSQGQHEDEPPEQCDPIDRQPLRWSLQFVSGHESFVSLKNVA